MAELQLQLVALAAAYLLYGKGKQGSIK